MSPLARLLPVSKGPADLDSKVRGDAQELREQTGGGSAEMLVGIYLKVNRR